MKLDKQVISLKNLGLAGKVDPKGSVPGRLTLAENVQAVRRVDDQAVELRKRNGFAEVPGAKAIDGGGAIAACVTGAAYNDELVLLDGAKLYSYSQTEAKWVAKGKLQTIAADTQIISGNEASIDVDVGFPQQPNVTVAYQGGYACYVASGDQVDPDEQPAHIYVVDTATGVIVASTTVIDEFRFRVIGVGSTFLIFSWAQLTTKLRCRKVAIAAPSTISAPVDVATDIKSTVPSPGGLFDAFADVTNTQAWVAYRDTSNHLVIKSWTTGNAAGVSSVYTGIDPNLCIGFLRWDFSNGHGYIGVGTDTASGGTPHETRVIDFLTSTGAESANTLLEAAAVGVFIRQITGYRTSGGVLNALWTKSPTAGTILTLIRGYSGGSLYNAIRGLSLSSRAFTENGRWYVLANYSGEAVDSPRLVLIEIPENSIGAAGDVSPAGLIMSNDASGPPKSPCCLFDVEKPTATTALSAVAGLLNRQAQNQSTSTIHYTVTSLSMDFAGVGLGAPTVYNGLLHVPTAAHKTYDGKDVVEVAFYIDPDAPTTLSVGSGSGDNLTPDSTYLYCYTFARFDSRTGRVHRSAPGPSQSVITPVVGTEPNPIVDGQLYALRVTDADPQYNINQQVSKVRLELWRTLADGEIFYLVQTLDNDATADAVDFEDIASDIAIRDNEILYTQSGELDNQKPPAVKALRAFATRLFALTGDGSTWHSKESAEGFGAEFSDEFRLLVEDAGGRPVGLGSIDATGLIFKRKRTYAFGGAGPDDKGAGSFPSPQPLEPDMGIVGPNSATDGPKGILCETPDGRFMLTRSLGFEPMEGTEAYAVTAAGGVGLDARSMTPLVTSGAVLVWDWQLNQWYAWTKATNGLAGVAIARWKNQLVIFQADGTVLREIVGQFFDATATAINEALEFTYVRLENARIYQLRLVGEIMGTTTLTETVTYNGNASTAASKTKAVTTADADDLNIIPNTGRMASVKFKLQETSTTEGFRLSQVGLEVGLKPGLKKVGAGRNFT